MKVYLWEGTLEHRKALERAQNCRGDVHGAVAREFEVTRQQAKEANYRLAYGNEPPGTIAPDAGVIATIARKVKS